MVFQKVRRSNTVKERGSIQLIVKSPNYQISRIVAKDDRMIKRSTRIYMNDLIDDESMVNLKNAIGYLENRIEQEVVVIAKVKTRKLKCNYLKLVVGDEGQFHPNDNQLKIICEWVY